MEKKIVFNSAPDTLGLRNFCRGCKDSFQIGNDTVCKNKSSKLYGLIVNQVLNAPCITPRGKTELQELFKKDPKLKAAFQESVKEMQQPENIKKMTERTMKFISAIQSLRGKK